MKDLIQSKFVKDFSFLTLSSFFSRVLLLLRDFYLASVLGPAVYGVWVQIIIILNYLLHLPLGFQHLASREIPFYEGANQTNKINQVYSLVFVVTFSTFFIYTIVVCLFKNSLFPDVNNWIFVSLFLILSLVYSMNANLSILLRASQQFSSFSIGSVVLAILALILMIILVPSTGIYGALISFLTGMIIVSIYWYRKLHYKINLRNLSFFYLESKYKASLNLFFVSLIGTLIISGDRLIVVYFYDSQSIGYYGLGFILTQGIFLIVTPINQAILPRLSKAFGNTNNIENQKPYFLILTKYLGFGVIFFSGSIFIVIELVIFFFLTEYTDALNLVRIVLIGSLFLAMANGASSFLLTIRKQEKVLKLQLKIIPLQMLAVLIGSYCNFNLEFIAFIMITFLFIYSFLVINLSLKFFENSNKKWESLIDIFLIPIGSSIFLIFLTFLTLSGDIIIDVTFRMILFLIFLLIFISFNKNQFKILINSLRK